MKTELIEFISAIFIGGLIGILLFLKQKKEKTKILKYSVLGMAGGFLGFLPYILAKVGLNLGYWLLPLLAAIGSIAIVKKFSSVNE